MDGGLLRSLHEPEDLLPAARAIAEDIRDNAAPVSVALTRHMMWKMLGADHPMEAHKIDSRGIHYRGKSADSREGVTAFLENVMPRSPTKSQPNYPSSTPGGKNPNSSSPCGYKSTPAKQRSKRPCLTRLSPRRAPILSRSSRGEKSTFGVLAAKALVNPFAMDLTREQTFYRRPTLLPLTEPCISVDANTQGAPLCDGAHNAL